MKNVLFIFCNLLLIACSSQPEQTQIDVPDNSQESTVSPDSASLRIQQKVTAIPIPDSLSFCGEPVPLDQADIRERLEVELLANTYRHSRTMLILERSKRWKSMIEDILESEGVPKDFFYLAIAESELSNVAKSPAGAMGMWQIMKGTGKEYGLQLDKWVDQRRDPELSTKVACEYIKKAYDKFNNWTLVAASYNMGMAGVRNRLDEQLVDSYYDLFLYEETSRYVFRILAFKVIIENPEVYGYYLPTDSLYQPLEFDTLTVSEDIDNLNEFAKKHGTNYKLLRQYNPWLNDGRNYVLKVPKKLEYIFRIPRATSIRDDSL